MPLDNPRKAAHIQAAVQRSWAGRQKSVVLVYNAGGAFSYVVQTVIFRPQEIIDPTVPDLTGGPPRVPADMLMICALSLVGVVYIADTATGGAVAAVHKYEIITAVPTGILPGGTHYVVFLRRLR